MNYYIEYPKCSTCKKAKRWLEENNIEFNKRDIVQENPSKQEIREWLIKSSLPLKRFFNTSGNLYKEMNLKDKLILMSEEEQIELLSTNGMLVRRPILVNDHVVLVGFKQEEWGKLKS